MQRGAGWLVAGLGRPRSSRSFRLLAEKKKGIDLGMGKWPRIAEDPASSCLSRQGSDARSLRRDRHDANRPPFFAINQMFVSPMLNDRGREKKPGVVEATFVEERRRNHIRSRINSIGVKNVDEDDGIRVRFSRVRRKEEGKRGREREDVQARALRRALKIRGRPLCLPNLEAFGISKASIRQFTSPLYPSRLMG